MHLEIPVLIDLLIHSITKLQPPLNLYFQSFMLLYKNYPFESQHYNCTISIYKYHWSYSAKIVIFIKINRKMFFNSFEEFILEECMINT